MSHTHDVLILGSGPAGYTAALYAARANLKPLLLAGDQPGGQLTITTEVENYPGFRESIMGPELMDIFRDQAARFGAEIRSETAQRVDFSRQPFTIWTDADVMYRARSVIVATGAQAMLLGLERGQASWASASRRARPATDSSSVTSASWSSAVETRRSRRRST